MKPSSGNLEVADEVKPVLYSNEIFFKEREKMASLLRNYWNSQVWAQKGTDRVDEGCLQRCETLNCFEVPAGESFRKKKQFIA